MSWAALDALDPATRAGLDRHLGETRRLARQGGWLFLAAVVPLLAWLSFAPLASAVVASAFVKVDLDRRPVQHAEGGLVREVKVRDGQRVALGEPLIVLHDVGIDADLQRLSHRLLTERASMRRLEAEQLGEGTLSFSNDALAAARTDARIAEHLATEQALFRSRREGLIGQVALLHAQRERIGQEQQALSEQVLRAGESLGFQKAELETNRGLHRDGFISGTRLAQLEAAVADYSVKLGERRSELARARQRAVEVDLRIQSLEADYRQQASDQLKLTSARLYETEQELRKSSDAAARQIITAPVAGEVLNLRFAGPGAVVAPRETIADIVPSSPRLVLQAHIRLEDIDRIRDGQEADIRFTAFNARTTGLIRGTVIYVSADRLVDPATNAPHYTALVEANAASLAASGGLILQAGMPAEVYIRGEERTPLQYLLEPVTQVLHRAARER